MAQRHVPVSRVRGVTALRPRGYGFVLRFASLGFCMHWCRCARFCVHGAWVALHDCCVGRVPRPQQWALAAAGPSYEFQSPHTPNCQHVNLTCLRGVALPACKPQLPGIPDARLAATRCIVWGAGGQSLAQCGAVRRFMSVACGQSLRLWQVVRHRAPEHAVWGHLCLCMVQCI